MVALWREAFVYCSCFDGAFTLYVVSLKHLINLYLLILKFMVVQGVSEPIRLFMMQIFCVNMNRKMLSQ